MGVSMGRRGFAVVIGAAIVGLAPGCSLLIHGKDTGRPCKNGQCPAGQVCDTKANACKAQTLCKSDADCHDPTLRCDASGACVDKCLGQVCPAGQICERGACGVPEYQDCSNAACVPGLVCVPVGTGKLCGQQCTKTSDCYNPGDRCDTDSTSPTYGYCVINYCSPDWTGAGVVQQASYLSSCNAAATGDGVCVGPATWSPSLGTLGDCEVSGTVPPGGTCDVSGSFGDPKLCQSGRCVAAHVGDRTGTCEAWCALLDNQTCDPVNGKPTACAWLGAGLGFAGSCAPQQAQPIAVGQKCSKSSLTLPCVHDTICIDLNDGKGQICHALCDLRNGDPCSQICTKIAPGEKLLGVCP